MRLVTKECFFVFSLLWLSVSNAALPPTTLKGQSGSKATTFNYEVPFNQATKTGGVNGLIETGNKNLLSNPGFEHQTFSTGYSVSDGTFVVRATGDAGFSQLGNKSARWTPDAADDFLNSAAITVPEGLKGSTGECRAQVAVVGAGHKLEVYDGSSVISEYTIPHPVSGYQSVSTSFTFPSSGTVQCRIRAGESSTIDVDDFYLGQVSLPTVDLTSRDPLPPTVSVYNSGTSTHYTTYYFFISTGSADSGATYTNNSETFTVVTTVSSGTILRTTGTGNPLVFGTLTKATGTGDATLTYSSYRSPVSMTVELVGGGGGGGGTGQNATGAASGGSGGNTTFGSLTAGGGSGGGSATNSSFSSSVGGAGGSCSGSPNILEIIGAYGSSPAFVVNTSSNTSQAGGLGGGSLFGGAGAGVLNSSGRTASANSGSGGGGGGCLGTSSTYCGSGGGSGCYEKHIYTSPSGGYSYSVGSGGSAGTAGTNGHAGGAGAAGKIIVREDFQ